MSNEDSQNLVEILSKNKMIFVDTMIKEEGVSGVGNAPVMQGIITFLSFVFFGCVPIIAYANTEKMKKMFFLQKIVNNPSLKQRSSHNLLGLHVNAQFLRAIIITGIMLFVLGALKVNFFFFFFFFFFENFFLFFLFLLKIFFFFFNFFLTEFGNSTKLVLFWIHRTCKWRICCCNCLLYWRIFWTLLQQSTKRKLRN